MPKFAATLASLLLIASSVGVNIARYPQVGQNITSSRTVDVPATPNSRPAANQPDLVETAGSSSLPASKPQDEPAKPPQAAAVTSAKKVASGSGHIIAHSDSKLKVAVNRPPLQLTIEILDVQPMVPLTSQPTLANAASPPARLDEVNRLPPVAKAPPVIDELQAMAGDAAEQYPATSTP